MKKILCLIIVICLAFCAVLTGCSQAYTDPTEEITAVASTDKYRNYYEIFVNSFCDSNGDDVGDLQGIISQLDYLNDGDPNSGEDLGIDGIWLTPIMPSKSYHKYDVEDYYDIDPDFGTLDDFDDLVEECHKRGISLIIDLVLNHISSQNPLYLQAVQEVQQGKLDGNAEYFEIHETTWFDGEQVNMIGTDYACEANFSHDMPEWNLNSEKTREEFTNIAKFWLDRGVDGFRLDAIKYYTNKETDGVEFLNWFYKTCQEINPDVYMVGENWDDETPIQEFYDSGIDSQFCFKFSQAYGTITSQVVSGLGNTIAAKVMNYNTKMAENHENYINAMFLSNHDMVRSANALEFKGESYEKMAAGVYMLFPGNSFMYYGEEIGIKAPNTTNDAAFRTAMIFDSDNLPTIWINSLGDIATAPKFGGVKQQLEDDNSLLNYYKRIIRIKNQNPEIARGEMTGVEEFEDTAICAYYVEYEGSKLMIIHNMSADESKELTITDEMIENPVIRADLVASNPVDEEGNFVEEPDENSVYQHITLNNGVLTMPAQSTVILKSK